MTTRPLLVSNDSDLVDEVLRLASANGVDLHLVADAESARARWTAAPLVLVGADCAGAVAATRPIRRPDVLLVTRAPSADDWQYAVAVGAEHVAALPDAERWLIDRLADSAEGQSRQGLLLAVMGAGSGSGASTFAATTALAGAAAGLRVMLVDADDGSGGLDLLLGIEDEPGLRWTDLAEARGRISAADLAEALPSVDGVAVLAPGRGDPGPLGRAELATSILDAGERGFDLVVVDVGRGRGPVGEAVVTRCRQAVLVTSNHVTPVAGAAHVARRLDGVGVSAGVVIRMDGNGVSDEAIRSVLPLRILGRLPRAAGLVTRADEGDPPGLRDAYGRACAGILDDLLELARPSRRSA